MMLVFKLFSTSVSFTADKNVKINYPDDVAFCVTLLLLTTYTFRKERARNTPHSIRSYCKYKLNLSF